MCKTNQSEGSKAQREEKERNGCDDCSSPEKCTLCVMFLLKR